MQVREQPRVFYPGSEGTASREGSVEFGEHPAERGRQDFIRGYVRNDRWCYVFLVSQAFG